MDPLPADGVQVSETQVFPKMPAHAAFPVGTDVEVAIFVVQLVVSEEIRSAVLDDFPEEEIRVHVPFDLQGDALGILMVAVAQTRIQG